MINFASDNYAPIHPLVLEKLLAHNKGPAAAYGNDEVTTLALQKFKDTFGQDTETHFVWNGTAANVLGLSSILHPHQSILCADTAHITADECGAPERHLGSKLHLLSTHDGKLTPKQLEPHLKRLGDVHAVQPKVISISQSTELGTVYTKAEIEALAAFAHSHQMFLHMDGARIANAAVSLNLKLKELTKDAGVDLLSFGGTKNGLLGAEAIVFLNPTLGASFPFIRKQGLHLASKMRYLSAQFLAYFENDLWKQNASHANQMARALESEIKKIPSLKITQSVQANAVFVSMPLNLATQLQKQFSFYLWNESKSEYRLMCSFNTTSAEVSALVQAVQRS